MQPHLACFLSLFLCFVFAIARTVRTPGFHVPIRRIPRRRPPIIIGNVLTTDISITNRNEFAYLVSASVGGQEFSVILDTGSSDFWIVSSECIGSDCSGITTYAEDRSLSLSLTDHEFSLSYLMGSVVGNVAFETVEIGRFEITSQVFALVNRTQGLGLSSTGNSGILGLSFPSVAAISLADGIPLLQNIVSAFDEPDRFFAFRLGRGFGPNDGTSSFTVGEIDQNITSSLADLSFTRVSKAGADDYNYWKLPLQSLTIDDIPFALSPSLVSGTKTQIAVLDTGTTLILGPTRDVEAFWRTVDQDGATRKNEQTGIWEVKCDRGVSVSFLLGDKGSEQAFPVDPGDINWEEGGSENGWCMGGVQANDEVNSGDWLLGGVFLRNVYATHHSANSTHEPLIGLLRLTDPSASMVKFREERGPEQPHGAAHWTSQHKHTIEFSPLTILIYVISSVCGFLLGGVITLVVRIRQNRSSS